MSRHLTLCREFYLVKLLPIGRVQGQRIKVYGFRTVSMTFKHRKYGSYAGIHSIAVFGWGYAYLIFFISHGLSIP